MTLRFLDAPATCRAAFAALPAALADWFAARFGEPTTVQRLAWPALAEDGHLLVSAATGTGKSLAALVPILGELLRQHPFTSQTWSTSPLRVLYVAPLKALVNDAARSLNTNLADLAGHIPDVPMPRVAVRTGDTAARDRQQLREQPPDVLLTTPESLAVLLSNGWSSTLFANLAWVVVDEVHAIAGNKRGADLALSLERLTSLVPTIRRVGLSATATPLTESARFLVGAGRDCTVVRVPPTQAPTLILEPLPEGARFLSALVDRLCRELPQHRSTLVFTNTRSLAERLAWALRRKTPAWDDLIAVHHSSLAATRRREVEERFKRGELRAVVSSTSLELGIDIGSIDLAVLIHPPGDVVRLLQRVGRAGHDPAGLRRGLVLTASAGELLECAVTMASGVSGQCEPLCLSAAPLDVLCQQMLGMCCARSWAADEMYELIHRAGPFADLSRRDFDDCLAYLRGVDANGSDWLTPRLREDGDCWRIAEARTARILRRNIGTILTETAVPVVRSAGVPPATRSAGVPPATRSAGVPPATRSTGGSPVGMGEASDIPTGEPPVLRTEQIGEVDESFADRLNPGDRFLLDGRCLEFRVLEQGSALVEEVVGRPRTVRWAGDGWPLSPELAHRLYVLRVRAAEALREGTVDALLRDEYALTGEAAETVALHFQLQEAVSEIPDASTLLIEGISGERGLELYFHTPLNRLANDALARVAVARLASEHSRSATSEIADLGFLLRLRGDRHDIPGLARSLLRAENFAHVLDEALSNSDALRSRFGRVAQTGLMVLRQPEGRKRRVGGGTWNERVLFESVRTRDADFVLLRQALRELRQEMCDVVRAVEYVHLLPSLTVRCRWMSTPSPFASAWTQRDDGAAEAALSPAEALTRLHAELTGATNANG